MMLQRLRKKRPDEGSVTVFLAIVAVALLAMLSLVFLGGQKMQAVEHANAVATQAARAAAQQVDEAALMAGQDPQVVPAQARQAADEVFDLHGATGSVEVTGTMIEVTTRVQHTSKLLSMFGIDHVTGDGYAAVTLLGEDPA